MQRRRLIRAVFYRQIELCTADDSCGGTAKQVDLFKRADIVCAMSVNWMSVFLFVVVVGGSFG